MDRSFITTPSSRPHHQRRGHRHADFVLAADTSLVTLNLRLDADPDRAVADVLSKIQRVKSVCLPVQDPIVMATGEPSLMYLSFDSKVPTPRGSPTT